MANKVGICNKSLSLLGVGKQIASLTENSSEARACNEFYESSLKATLRDFPWPFSTKIVALGLVEEEPNSEWAYSYTYPSDCLMDRRILSGMRQDTTESRVPYRVVSDGASGQLIYTDQEDAELEYTFFNENASVYPADFELAFAWRLAVYCAPRVTKGDPFKNADKAMTMYLKEISRAERNATRQGAREPEPDSYFERCR